MAPPFADEGVSGAGVSPAPQRRKEPEPTPAQITKAVAFLRDALKDAPRLVREVEAEAKRQGHARRTLSRARAQLHVKKLPPDVFRGPWRMALPDDPAVAAYQRRKEAKTRQARQRQGNGRKRRKRGGSRGRQSNKLLISVL